MSQQLVFFSIDIIAAFAVPLFGLHTLLTAPRQLNARLIALISLNTVCAILLSRQELSYWIADPYRINVGILALPFHIARNLTPGLIMILCHSLFQDRARLPRLLLVAFALQITMEAVATLMPQSSVTQYAWFKSIPALLELAFIVLALYWLLRGWQEDLVEARRQLRWTFLVIVGVFTFLVVLLERLVIPWGAKEILYTHVAGSVFNILLVSFALLKSLRVTAPSFVNPFVDEKKPEPLPTVAVHDHPDAEATAGVLHALQVEHVYRDCELTVASLAAKLSMPEYRLRKLIHERLGYRNFNALLHEYRIAEACEALADKTKNHLPILTIALTVGYNSINPFNRAFKELKGMTPSTFRAQPSATA